MQCFLDPDCVSYNLEKRPSGNDGTRKCELNDATHEGHEDDGHLVTDESYVYQGAEASVTLNRNESKTRMKTICQFLKLLVLNVVAKCFPHSFTL